MGATPASFTNMGEKDIHNMPMNRLSFGFIKIIARRKTNQTAAISVQYNFKLFLSLSA